MFTYVSRCLFSTMIVLAFLGCSAGSSVETGISPSTTLTLDEQYETIVHASRGDVLAFDMAVPVDKGYVLSGASFDPNMLRMERYVEYQDSGTPRAHYLFTVLTEGASDVLVKMAPVAGGESEIYRQVTVTTAKSDGWF